MEKDKLNMNRREFLKRLGIGTGSALALRAMEPLSAFAQKDKKVVDNRMTYRVQHGSGEQISLLGFGMMRLPNNQEEVNQLVDYAIEHGVNYYDTAPMYMRGQSEVLMGNALSRHPRDKYFVATKMSNQGPNTWSFDASKRMYEQSMERLKVDHIDYYLLHGIGGGMNTLKGRFLDNGILEFLQSLLPLIMLSVSRNSSRVTAKHCLRLRNGHVLARIVRSVSPSVHSRYVSPSS